MPNLFSVIDEVVSVIKSTSACIQNLSHSMLCTAYPLVILKTMRIVLPELLKKTWSHQPLSVKTQNVSHLRSFSLDSKTHPKAYGFKAFTRKRFIQFLCFYVMAVTYFVSWDLVTIIPFSAAIFIQHGETSRNRQPGCKIIWRRQKQELHPMLTIKTIENEGLQIKLRSCKRGLKPGLHIRCKHKRKHAHKKRTCKPGQRKHKRKHKRMHRNNKKIRKVNLSFFFCLRLSLRRCVVTSPV